MNYMPEVLLGEEECVIVSGIIKNNDKEALEEFLKHYKTDRLVYASPSPDDPEELRFCPFISQVAAYYKAYECFTLLITGLKRKDYDV